MSKSRSTTGNSHTSPSPRQPAASHVVATAGHVDHGKSALVRALTGIEPDRWDEERRRGLTIDLGYAWTTLPDGQQVSFVDVPGHERFIGNMLAGLGPVPAVMVVVAADEGWRQQSSEHLAAIDALGVRHGLLVVTRSDLADPAPALADARARIAATSLGDVEAVAVSARTGAGLEELRAALERLLAALPPPRAEGRVRWWLDRAFTIKGAGTVVTGTLAEGALAVGDQLEVAGQRVAVRGLESLGQTVTDAAPVCRVAANLRGLAADSVGRGDVAVTPGAWRFTTVLDVRLGARDWPTEVVVHVGTAAVPARLRPLGTDHARLTLATALPVVAGDRLIVRDPGTRDLAGALVLDADPPALTRRGAAATRAAELAKLDGRVDPTREVTRRGAMRAGDLILLGGHVPQGSPPRGIHVMGEWLVAEGALAAWADAALSHVRATLRADPLASGVQPNALADAIGLPDRALVPAVVKRAGLSIDRGVVRPDNQPNDLGPAEAGLRAIEERLRDSPFAAPERPDLEAAGLSNAALAAAERAGRLVRLGPDLVLLPDGPARAMRELAALPQPFTLSQARQALGTTRRVAVPLLEHLDRRGWTRRVDDQARVVVR
ncbi:selenocysteine-specific translation elongation factor [Knoellia koreensis]|uniref:Selenocysteine-specific translation elongation factor n=1 Tax=Knoellia koreensis TaxID=2730921 RepID=A0A849H6K9_9MICO|nr:selenocysteine-specific translation elongation factor [Knoellia sp. DB2414S]NNM45416.1 selenocysteine-specific translation elongation factor [Knoellia sp. DB2414S]